MFCILSHRNASCKAGLFSGCVTQSRCLWGVTSRQDICNVLVQGFSTPVHRVLRLRHPGGIPAGPGLAAWGGEGGRSRLPGLHRNCTPGPLRCHADAELVARHYRYHHHHLGMDCATLYFSCLPNAKCSGVICSSLQAFWQLLKVC